MTTIIGPHFQIGPDHAVFFDTKGTRINDDTWTYNIEGDDNLRAIWPAPISPTIRSCIEFDRRSGYGEKVAQIHLNQRAAVYLSLERLLTVETVNYAEVAVDRFVHIPRFPFDGNFYSLVVVKDLYHDVMTTDERGNPL